MTGAIIACRTPAEFELEIAKGYVVGLQRENEYYLMKIDEYEKLASDMQIIARHYRDIMRDKREDD